MKQGRAEGLQTSLMKALVSLRETLSRRGIAPGAYEKDLQKLTDVGQIVDLAASFMAADDPSAYLRRRFGH